MLTFQAHPGQMCAQALWAQMWQLSLKQTLFDLIKQEKLFPLQAHNLFGKPQIEFDSTETIPTQAQKAIGRCTKNEPAKKKIAPSTPNQNLIFSAKSAKSKADQCQMTVKKRSAAEQFEPKAVRPQQTIDHR